MCVTCKGKFSSFEELQGHLDQSVACKKVNSTCEVCGKVCANRKMLSQHKLTHSERPQYVCDQCGKVYSNVFNLENHKSQVHGDETDFGYVYKCCDLTFKTRRELNEHTATHTKILNLLCDACGKSFTSQKALKSHAMSHTNIRPFSCDMCQKAFRTKLLLVQVHFNYSETLHKTKILPITCVLPISACPRAYRREGVQLRHLRKGVRQEGIATEALQNALDRAGVLVLDGGKTFGQTYTIDAATQAGGAADAADSCHVQRDQHEFLKINLFRFLESAGIHQNCNM